MFEVFNQGGMIVLVIAALSLTAWIVVIWKWQNIKSDNIKQLEWAEEVVALARRRDISGARQHCLGQSGCVARMLDAVLRMKKRDRKCFDKYMLPLAEVEELKLKRGLGFVQALGSAAPLLGLLGTVMGMIRTFASITEQAPIRVQEMSAGISQALFSTQAGLIVGLIIILIHGRLDYMTQRCIDTALFYAKKTSTALLHD